MKILNLLAIISFLVFFTACSEKDEVTPSYELRFTCTSSNPYLIEVNGNSDVITGNSFINYTLKKGTYAWKVTQQSGYALYPTVNQGTVNLDTDKEIVFP